MDSLKQKFLIDTGWSLSGRFTGALTGLIVNALLARLLQPEGLGIYFLAISIVSFFALIGTFGCKGGAIKLVAEPLGRKDGAQARAAVMTILKIVALVASLTAVGFFLIIDPELSSKLFNNPYFSDISVLVALWIFLTSMKIIICEIFRGMHDLKSASIFEHVCTNMIFLLILVTIILWKYEVKIDKVITFYLCALTITTIVAYIRLSIYVRQLPSDGVMPLKKIFHVTLPLYFGQLAVFGIGELHFWILAISRPSEELALYGAAYRIVNIIWMPMLVIKNVISPIIADLISRQEMRKAERVLQESATIVMGVGVLSVCFFIFVGGKILSLLYGPYYSAAYVTLLILLIGQLANTTTGYPGVLLVMTGRQNIVLFLSIVGGAVGVTVSLVTVESHGQTGVALGASVSVALYNLLMWWYSKAVVKVNTHGSPKYFIKTYRLARNHMANAMFHRRTK